MTCAQDTFRFPANDDCNGNAAVEESTMPMPFDLYLPSSLNDNFSAMKSCHSFLGSLGNSNMPSLNSPPNSNFNSTEAEYIAALFRSQESIMSFKKDLNETDKPVKDKWKVEYETALSLAPPELEPEAAASNNDHDAVLALPAHEPDTTASNNEHETEKAQTKLEPATATSSTNDVRKKRAAPVKNSRSANCKTAKKPRRVIPECKEFIEEDGPTDLDVVGGRGGVSTHHSGNRRYWREVLERREEYKACLEDNQGKREIAKSIVDFVHDYGGRFLQKDAETKRFFVLPDKVAVDKVKQALRDDYVPLWARN